MITCMPEIVSRAVCAWTTHLKSRIELADTHANRVPAGEYDSALHLARACGRKERWHTFMPDIEAGYAPWLFDNGSLTRRIQQRCNQFGVHNLCDCLKIAAHDETTLLALPSRQKIYTREVFLYADQRPVVFAHSVVAPQHLRGAWQALQKLGNRPLAALLFAHPLVQRAPLHYQTLKGSHPLFRRAADGLAVRPFKLWARRSLFTLHGAPLLVTEVFLPDILKLHK
jgi:chorismate--pyruvate lyase